MFLRSVGLGANHTPRRCEYCWIRANVVEGSFRLEIGPLTQWNRRFFRQFKGILEDSQQERCWEPMRINLEAMKLKIAKIAKSRRAANQVEAVAERKTTSRIVRRGHELMFLDFKPSDLRLERRGCQAKHYYCTRRSGNATVRLS